jgi:hypothetical protein
MDKCFVQMPPERLPLCREFMLEGTIRFLPLKIRESHRRGRWTREWWTPIEYWLTKSTNKGSCSLSETETARIGPA